MKILLATDGSEYSKVAVKEVANIPFAPKTKVLVLSSFEHSPAVLKTQLSMGGDVEYFRGIDATAHKSALEAVDYAVKLLKDKNPTLSVSKLVTSGISKEVILEEAEKFGADLIVVGSQGKGAISRFLLGSVSQALALHSPCSVMIVKKKKSVKKK